MKVAIVHYWLVGMRGGEKVLEELCALYPEADLFTLVADEGKLSPALRKHRITTSFLQKMGGVKGYQRLLPLMPMALESFDLTGYDLVISSEAGPAKGIVPAPDALHVCYCHSPMRYIWDLYPQYHARAGRLARLAMTLTAPWLRAWDVTTAARVDHFIANSQFVADRIDKYYRREAVVINPPVDTERFEIAPAPGDFYLCAGQITPYKKVEIAVEAFTRLGKRLVVAGSGVTPAMRRMAGPNVVFLGAVDDATLTRLLSECRALVFPGLEDFGIVPLEALASGRPVVAYGRGGALETVIDGQTGVLFGEQTPQALAAAVLRMEQMHAAFDPRMLRAFAERFDRTAFRLRLRAFFDQAVAAHRAKAAARREDIVHPIAVAANQAGAVPLRAAAAVS
jgi:glycosyltransferase involved in cell wall biosynthesis